MKRIHLLLILLVAFAAAPAVHAQQAIDRVIAAIEKDKNTSQDTYSERRNPSNGKIYRSSKILVLTGDQMKRVLKSMDDCREHCVRYERAGDDVIRIDFSKGTETRRYTLYRDGRRWQLMVDIRVPQNAPSGERRMHLDGEECPFIFNDSLFELNTSGAVYFFEEI